MIKSLYKTRIAVIALFASLCLVNAGCGKKSEAKEQDEAKPEAKANNLVVLKPESVKDIGLVTITATESELHGVLAVPAKVLADQDQQAEVGSLVQGRVQKIFVRLGDRVSAGQALMSITSLEVGEMQSAFIKAQGQVAFAEAALKRQKTLYEQKIGSQKALQEAESEYNKAVAELNSEDKKIHSIGLTDKDVISSSDNNHTTGTLVIKSPISGVVVERNVVLGQLVDNSTNAFGIINTSSVWADGQVYEKDLSKVGSGQVVNLTLPALAGEIFRGKIIFTGQVVDERTRTITVRAEIPNPGARLKPQMFGQMEIPLSGNTRGILVPNEAVIREDKNDFVFVMLNDTTFEKRLVETGIKQDGAVEISKGISPGERIVTKGVFYLKSEMLKSSFGEEE